MPIAVPSGPRHRTKQEFVYQTLRSAIMRCDLPPGSRLVIDDLARQLTVSSIPIREALQTLQSEGLVVTVPHVGATVAPISRESVRDVFAVLEGLQTVATRLVAERRDPAVFHELRRIVAEIDDVVSRREWERFPELNRGFHLTIADAPGLEMLGEMTARVLDRWSRVRRYYFEGVDMYRIEQAQQEHQAMVRAMERGDLAALHAVVHAHYESAMSSYLRYLDAAGTV